MGQVTTGDGHNIDTDIYEELSGEADGFLSNAVSRGKCYDPLSVGGA